MGRIREFEDDQVLDRAMKLFWEKGYEHTSLKDLLAVMNIQNSSFYNAFGSKKNLFIQSLEAYYADLSTRREKLFLSSAPIQEKIRAVFQYALERQKKKDCPKGCFLVNSMSADALEDEDIRKIVQGCVDDFEGYFAKHIRQAIKDGEVDPGIDPKSTAAAINIFFQGLLKLSVLEFSEAKFQKQTDFFLSALKL